MVDTYVAVKWLNLYIWKWTDENYMHKKTCFSGDLRTGEKAGSSMMELNNWFQKDWIKSQNQDRMVFHRPFYV
jgi:hypothetical protein